MRSRLYLTTLAVALAAGIGAAVAAGPVNLTEQQQQSIQQGLSSQAGQSAPSEFTAKVGEKVPDSVNLDAMPSDTADQVPELKGHDFAKFENNEIIIVDPSSREVVAVIHQSSTTGASPSSNESEPKNEK